MTLKQKQPLTRKVSLRPSSITKTPKPKKGPKSYKCKNPECRGPYFKDPAQPWKDWCSVECGAALAMLKLAKQKASKAKAERAADKLRKEQGMPLKDRLKATEALVNRYVVLRDRHDGCISCEKGAHWDGVWHASHFKSVGSNSALRYNLWNIHKSCSQCNVFRAGNIAVYEPRLVQKIGAEKVEFLKHADRSKIYTTEYLMRLSAIMRRKIKRLERKK